MRFAPLWLTVLLAGLAAVVSVYLGYVLEILRWQKVVRLVRGTGGGLPAAAADGAAGLVGARADNGASGGATPGAARGSNGDATPGSTPDSSAGRDQDGAGR